MQGVCHRYLFLCGLVGCLLSVDCQPTVGQSKSNIAAQAKPIEGKYNSLFPGRAKSRPDKATGWPDELKMNQLSAGTRMLIMQARAENLSEIAVVVAANHARTVEVGNVIKQAGGRIVSTLPEIDYLFAVIRPDDAEWIIAQPDVTDLAVASSSIFSVPSARVPALKEAQAVIQQQKDDEQKRERAEIANSPGSGNVNSSLPLFPTKLIGLAAGYDANDAIQGTDWLGQHPAWDGRGVTIADISSGPADLSHPLLQDAHDLSGNAIAKSAGIIDAKDPENPDVSDYMSAKGQKSLGVLGEVKFSSQPKLSGGEACSGAPYGKELVGVWNSRFYNQTLEYCVTWNEEEGRGYVDAKNSGLPRDRIEFGDFSGTHKFMELESVPEHARWAVYASWDASSKHLVLNVADDNHETMVSTAAAGTKFDESSVGGVAPAARLMYMSAGEGLDAFLRTYYLAAANPEVDVLTSSWGTINAPGDTQPIVALLLDRISYRFHKPILQAALNDPHGASTANYASRALTIGEYNTAETLRDFSYVSVGPDVKAGSPQFQASGPSPSGGFAPDVIATEKGIAGGSCAWQELEKRAARRQVGMKYRLGPCLMVSGGSSVAAPRAAGVFALLISAAKQIGLKYDEAMLRQAMLYSAKYLPDETAARQGHGLIQVEAAWKLLNEYAKHPVPEATVETPAILPMHPELWRGPRVGRGIYMLRGIEPGMAVSSPVTIRFSGQNVPKSVEIENVGNASWLSAPMTIEVVKGIASFDVITTPDNAGVFSSILRVSMPDSHLPITDVPVTIAATPKKELQEGREIAITGKLYPNSPADLLYLEAPRDSAGLQVSATFTGTRPEVDFVHTGQTFPLFQPREGSSEVRAGNRKNNTYEYIFPFLYPGDRLVDMNVMGASDTDITGSYELRVKSLPPASSPSATLPQTPVPVTSSLFGSTQEAAFSFPADAPIVNIQAEGGKDNVLHELYLYKKDIVKRDGKDVEQWGLWTYIPYTGKTLTYSIPNPVIGDAGKTEWKAFATSAGKPIHITASTSPLPPPDQRLSQFCKDNCLHTWPMENPYWRNLPFPQNVPAR